MNSSAANDRVAFRCGDFTGHDLVLELAGLLRGLGLVAGGERELVLLARVMPYFFATFSAVVPMWYWL
jgi:hypothetical protein